MDGTILLSGKFTSDGTTKLVNIPSDADYMYVINYTNIENQDDDGVRFYWQRGMDDDTGIEYYKINGADDLAVTALASDGFTRVDTSANPFSAAVALTAATDATQPVVSTASTAGLANGDVVLLTGMTGQESLGGYEFQIDTLVANTSFRLAYAMANSPGAAATAGNWRKVKWDPIYYPRRRFVANITAANPAVVTTTVDHGLSVGQKVRMVVPAVFDMVQMDGLAATVTAVTASTLTLDIDSSGFTAFSFALPADVPFSPALVVPFGEDTAEANSANVDALQDATDNQSVIAMSLAPGDDGPAGANNDVMYWVAGKSTLVNNE